MVQINNNLNREFIKRSSETQTFSGHFFSCNIKTSKKLYVAGVQDMETSKRFLFTMFTLKNAFHTDQFVRTFFSVIKST